MSPKRVILIALFLALFSIPFVLLVFWLVAQFMLVGFAFPYALLSESTNWGYVRIAVIGTLLNAVPIIFGFFCIQYELQIENWFDMETGEITGWIAKTALAEFVIITFVVLGFAFNWSF